MNLIINSSNSSYGNYSSLSSFNEKSHRLVITSFIISATSLVFTTDSRAVACLLYTVDPYIEPSGMMLLYRIPWLYRVSDRRLVDTALY